MAKRRPINFRALRQQISPARVLLLAGISYQTDAHGITRARCPFHDKQSRRPRCWRANTEVWYCDRDRLTGDAVQLYARLKGLSVLDAAYALCEELRLEIPYL